VARPRLTGRRTGGAPADVVVVGLGNPGSRYDGSRHNVGFDTINEMARRHQATMRGVKGLPVTSAEVRIGGQRVVLAMPTTFMNESGQAVGPLLHRHHVDDPGRLVVVHDELDLAPGRLRIKVGGGLAGHNGLRSIDAHIHNRDFVRVRIGVGKPPNPEAGAGYVLGRVPAAERRVLDDVVALAADAVECIVTEDATVAQERFNGIEVT
jgi:PTH1 family peptidyl-tRNA hydrolase